MRRAHPWSRKPLRRSFPQLLLSAAFGICAAACSPACNPPEAKAPGSDEPRGPSDEGKSGDGLGGKAKAIVAEHEKKRAELPKDDTIEEAPGVDIGKLSEPQRGVFFQIINTEPSACDKPHSLARSLQDDPGCRDSMLLAQFISDALSSGAATSAIKEAVPQVAEKLRPKEIDITGRPVWGEPSAQVTVVVFADFQCPHCRAEAPKLRKAIDSFRGRAKLVYKHYPLPFHDRAKVAAIATEAAHEQGKFWPMHDLVFENQEDLTDDNLYAFAERIGLDMAKFRASFDSKKFEATVNGDRADGEALGISGTPAVFVDGREVTPALFGGSVTAYIDDALKR